MKKIFTFIAVALLSLTANAFTVTWDEKFLDEIDVWADYEDPSNNAENNNSLDGITLTMTANSPNGLVGVYNYDLWFEQAGGTITFTSSVGKITKIQIFAPSQYSIYNSHTSSFDYYDNFNGSGSFEEKEWEHVLKPVSLVWEGEPATVVTMSNTDYVVNSISSIVFTIEDPAPEAVPGKDIEVDFSTALLGESHQKYLVIDAEDAQHFVDEATTYNAYFKANSYNGSQHGYVGLKATIPVEAGNYKITLGRCNYNSNPAYACVKNTDETATLNLIDENGQTITSFTPGSSCYNKSTGENTLSAWFVASEDQTIKVICAEYTPYFKIEKVESVPAAQTLYTITFVNEESGAKGTVPAALQVVAGESFTVPANRTLYYAEELWDDYYTLTGWNDGSKTYKAGDVIVPEGDMTLTAVYTKNTVNLLTTKNAVTVKWEFGKSNGAPSVTFNESNGILVTQATVEGQTIDVQLEIRAKSSKFDNSTRNDEWAQVNSGVGFFFLSKSGVEVEVKSYADPGVYTKLDGNSYTGSWTNNIATFTTTSPSLDPRSYFLVGDGQYYSYIKVTFPDETATAIDNTSVDTKAVKRIVDGQVLIERNGELYTLQGQLVK